MGILSDERVEKAAATRVGHKLAWLWFVKKTAGTWLALGLFIFLGFAAGQVKQGHWRIPEMGGGGVHVSPVVYVTAGMGILLLWWITRFVRGRRRGYRVPRGYR